MKNENQLLKKQIREMIDEALTPQVRAFMPVMLSKIQQIERLGDIDRELQETIEKVRAHNRRIDSLEELSPKNEKNFESIHKEIQEVNTTIDSLKKKTTS